MAVNVCGLLFATAAAVSEYEPTVAPSVQDVSAAIPAALVVTITDAPELTPLETTAPGAATVKVTAMPAIGLPKLSAIMTDGAMPTAVPTTAVCRLPPFITRFPVAPVVTAILPDVVLVSVPLAKRRVRGPTNPPIDRFVKVATPEALVTMVATPPSVPPPDAIDAVTVTPACNTALAPASTSWTTGCGASGEPASALVAGCVVMRSAAATPAVMLTVFDVTAVRTPSPNCSVRIPTAPVIVRFAKVATPVASDVAVVVPPRVPGPLAIVAVAVWPARLTGFRKLSARRTTGAGVNVAPFADTGGG